MFSKLQRFEAKVIVRNIISNFMICNGKENINDGKER